ncbi:hypothetical protein HPB50_013678 [Hyalomma asiaticum]|uniref:Uncharacterized protein n=1 Tax=Hyalomma asiaticum TaxID=266040 RepID=A0ACB7THQ2_HYAAI|nr:hypothetical protein HPB50_013678 [Hyalomma asiaticum]
MKRPVNRELLLKVLQNLVAGVTPLCRAKWFYERLSAVAAAAASNQGRPGPTGSFPEAGARCSRQPVVQDNLLLPLPHARREPAWAAQPWRSSRSPDSRSRGGEAEKRNHRFLHKRPTCLLWRGRQRHRAADPGLSGERSLLDGPVSTGAPPRPQVLLARRKNGSRPEERNPPEEPPLTFQDVAAKIEINSSAGCAQRCRVKYMPAG